MRKVVMIRAEPGLVSMPIEKAVCCENCDTVSTSSGIRCGICGSERIFRLCSLLPEPSGPSPASASLIAA